MILFQHVIFPRGLLSEMLGLPDIPHLFLILALCQAVAWEAAL
jgi:hypothetical protein